ncbi:hypothetical protein H7R52_02755 [Weissella confusa]|uniref:Uncharacterized protein n=1 Tax=Weissella confusa TaxID=1583 RepID=A0A923SMP5_WEICO|nr:hypothetical protein [Weissella confusa]
MVTAYRGKLGGTAFNSALISVIAGWGAFLYPTKESIRCNNLKETGFMAESGSWGAGGSSGGFGGGSGGGAF